jgi:hypothetical protein
MKKLTDNACPHCGLQCNGDAMEMQAKIARLTDQLTRLMQVAETACRYLDQGGCFEDELYSGKEGWVTETEIDEVCAKLALIKEEAK